MQNLWETDRGKLLFNFHDGQLQAWDSRARFVYVLAGTQGGKTSFGPWWLWREIQNTAREGGTNDYLAVTATYDLFKLKMLPALREAFEDVLGIGRFWASDRIIELRDPSDGSFWAETASDKMWGRIILRAASSGGGLESTTGRAAWLDECGQDEFTVETAEAVRRRLSLTGGRILGTTTPYNLGWLKERFEAWRRGDKELEFVQFSSTLNPLFSHDEFEAARERMPPWRFQMFYEGQFGKPAGLIYDCWDSETQVIEPFEIPAMWPRYVGLDFGAVNTALVWLAHDVDKDRWVAYRESLEGGLSTNEHVRRAIRDGAVENVVAVYGGAPSEEQQRMDWTAAGLGVLQPPISDVEGGISRVYGLMKRKRLYVFRHMQGLLDEIGSYRRKLEPDGTVTEVIEDKRKFHRLDALRYAAAGISVGGVQYAKDPWG